MTLDDEARDLLDRTARAISSETAHSPHNAFRFRAFYRAMRSVAERDGIGRKALINAMIAFLGQLESQELRSCEGPAAPQASEACCAMWTAAGMDYGQKIWPYSRSWRSW